MSHFITTAAYVILYSSLVGSATVLLIGVLIALRREKVSPEKAGRQALKPEDQPGVAKLFVLGQDIADGPRSHGLRR